MNRPKRTRRDTNHSSLVADCRKAGIIVWDTADIGGEVLDTVMFWRGKMLPVEIKAPGREADLTKAERESIERLRLIGIDAAIVTTIEDVLSAFGG